MNKYFKTIILFFIAAVPAFCQTPCLAYDSIAPAENCLSACVSCTFSGFYEGHTGTSASSGFPGCFDIENDQWLAFIATKASAKFKITSYGCTDGKGIQVAVYQHCNQPPLECRVGCSTCAGVPIEILVLGLEIGKVYYLLIDGYEGDSCGYSLAYQSFNETILDYSNVGLGILYAAGVKCPGNTVECTVSSNQGESSFTWTAPPQFLINGQQSPVTLDAPAGKTVAVTIPSTSSYNGISMTVVKVVRSNYCYSSQPLYLTNGISDIVKKTLPDTVVCHEALPYILPWGEEAYTPGKYIKIFPNGGSGVYDGCDSTVVQQLYVRSAVTKLQSKTICKNAPAALCDTTYATPGVHVRACPNIYGCDSVITLQLQVVSPHAEILPNNQEISCLQPTTQLHVGAINGDFVWRDETSGELHYDPLYTVNHPGLYTLAATLKSGNLVCVDRDTITVTANPDDQTPYAYAVANGALNCEKSLVSLTGATLYAADSIVWTKPDGNLVNTNVIETNTPGTFIFSAYSAGADCPSFDTLIIAVDTSMGIITTRDTTWDCSTFLVPLPLTTSLDEELSYLWSIPPNFLSVYKNPLVLAPGIYTVTVTNITNGCTEERTVKVVDISDTPLVLAHVIHDLDSIGMGSIDLTITGGAAPYSIIWKKNNTTIATSEDIISLYPGVYRASIKDANQCDTTLIITLLGPPSDIIEPQEEQIVIQPNPCTDYFVVTSQIGIPISSIAIYDITGHCVLRENLKVGRQIFDVSKLLPGIYFYQILTPKKMMKVGKMIKM